MNKTTVIILAIIGVAALGFAAYTFMGNSDSQPVDEGKQEAQDYNSSRSNKPSPLADTKDEAEDDVVESGSARWVQEYNSNRTDEPTQADTDEDTSGETTGGDSEVDEGKQEVQDYNSSRSNKPRPATAEGVGVDDDSDSDGRGDAEAATGASIETQQAE